MKMIARIESNEIYDDEIEYLRAIEILLTLSRSKIKNSIISSKKKQIKRIHQVKDRKIQKNKAKKLLAGNILQFG